MSDTPRRGRPPKAPEERAVRPPGARNAKPDEQEARAAAELLERLRSDVGRTLVDRHGQGRVPCTWSELAAALVMRSSSPLRRAAAGQVRVSAATLQRWERLVGAWCAGEEAPEAEDSES